MEAWKRLRTVIDALSALNWILLVVSLGVQAYISKLILDLQDAPLVRVFLATAPLTVAFAVVTFLFVESQRIRSDSQLENSPLAIYGGSTVILIIAVVIGQSLGYAEVELTGAYATPPPSSMPLVYWIFYILLFPIYLLGGVMFAYGLGIFFLSVLCGIALGLVMLYVLG